MLQSRSTGTEQRSQKKGSEEKCNPEMGKWPLMDEAESPSLVDESTSYKGRPCGLSIDSSRKRAPHEAARLIERRLNFRSMPQRPGRSLRFPGFQSPPHPVRSPGQVSPSFTQRRINFQFTIRSMPYLTDLYYQAYQSDDPDRWPLVLIHGAGGDHLSWPSQLRRLRGYRVYTPDLPGHGKSTGHGLQGIPSYGQAAASWLQALELPKAFLAGHSMGGAIALWLALHYPELIRALVLISTGARLPVNLSLIEELATQVGFPTAVDKITGWFFSTRVEPALVENVRKQMLKTRPSVLAGDFRACDRFDLSDRLGEIQIPTLILVGDEDKMTPERFAEKLAEGIPGAELQVIPRSGHMLPLEAPDAVAKTVRGFLEQVLER